MAQGNLTDLATGNLSDHYSTSGKAQKTPPVPMRMRYFQDHQKKKKKEFVCVVVFHVSFLSSLEIMDIMDYCL